MQDSEPTPPDPYNPDLLSNGVEVDAGPLQFFFDNPIAGGIALFAIAAGAYWVIDRNRRRDK